MTNSLVEQEDQHLQRQRRRRYVKGQQACMGKQPANEKHQAPSQPGLCTQHSPVHQRVLDNPRKARKAAQRFPPPLSRTPPEHQTARQS